MSGNEYLILPCCDDTNRGDQALIWETVEIAKEAGFIGHYSMIALEEEGRQSKKRGIDSLAYLLPHPSMHSKKKRDNRKYDALLKIRWGFATILDLIIAVPLSTRATRSLAEKLLNCEQKRTLDVYKKAKAAFVKGGGFLHSNNGMADIYKIYYLLYHINIALSMGIPVYVMPNSYGPFGRKVASRMVKQCLSKCKIVYARESISQRVLEECCNVRSELSSDLAVYLKKDESFNARQSLIEKGIKYEPGRMIGITVRPYRFSEAKNADELYLNYKKAICEIIIWLKQNGYKPVLIEHVYSSNYHEKDIICIEEITEMLVQTEENVDVFSDLRLDCMQMKAIYGEMDYVIGTRFHSVIFSLCEHVPAVAITYGGNKGKGIMTDIGLEEYTIPIDKISGSQLINTFCKMLSDEKRIREKLDEFMKKSSKDYSDIVRKIQEMKRD